MSADRKVRFIASTMEQVTFAELQVNVVAGVGVPDEADDFHEKLAVFAQLGVACLQERVRSAAHPGVFRGEHRIDVSFRYCAKFDHVTPESDSLYHQNGSEDCRHRESRCLKSYRCHDCGPLRHSITAELYLSDFA